MDSLQQVGIMQKRPWSEAEDRCLKQLFETEKPSKWSQLAREMQLRGFRGRNGVQCKERYCSYINPLHPRDEWTRQEQEQMVQLHNQLGNRWAQIGKKLGGRSDNCVKNQYYCLLRKSLKRLNRLMGKEIKEFKPAILYQVVEVAEQKFKDYKNHSKEFSFQSNDLKNRLLKYSHLNEYDDEQNEEAKSIVESLSQFRSLYQKKTKKSRKNSAVEQDLLTPTRYSIKHHSEHDESDNSSACLSSELELDSDKISERLQRNKSHNSRSIHSIEEEAQKGENYLKSRTKQIRTRSRSQGNLLAPVPMPVEGAMNEEQAEPEAKKEFSPIQQMLDGMKILGEEAECPPPLFMRKVDSTRSRQSQGDRQELHRFFEDTPYHVTIRFADVDQNYEDDFAMVEQQ